MASGDSAAVKDIFIGCCQQWSGDADSTMPSDGLTEVLKKLGLGEQEIDGLLPEFDAGGGRTNYVDLAESLWGASGAAGSQQQVSDIQTSAQTLAQGPAKQATQEESSSQVKDFVVSSVSALDTATGEQRTGLKRQTLPDGSVYEGQFQGSERHGWGRICFGNVYEGQWSGNEMHGQGKFISPDGSVYEGQWLSNRIEGDGSISWAGGPNYHGQFRNGQQHGVGKIHWPDGRSYDGEFAQGKQHGRGRFTSAAGICRMSEWNEGKLVKWLDPAPQG